jgi:hypothetical protein
MRILPLKLIFICGRLPVDNSVENPNQPEFIELLAASDAYMAQLYPAKEQPHVGCEHPEQAEVTFIVARVDAVRWAVARSWALPKYRRLALTQPDRLSIFIEKQLSGTD